MHFVMSTSYYTPPMAYGIYCTRAEGAKRLRASAVNDTIHHWRRVVTSLSQEYTPYKCRLFEFSSMSNSEGMAKRKQLLMKDLPPKSKGRFNFDLDNEDFEHFKLGYVPLN